MLFGKTILITGVASGIGARTAELAGQLGADVIGVDVREPAAPVGSFVKADISSKAGVDELIARLPQRLDALCNVAGLSGNTGAAATLAVNFFGLRVLSEGLAPRLREGGAIVNVASIAGRIPLPEEATYSATKFGLRAFTFALADELEGSGITVSAVSPGPVETGFILKEVEDVPAIVFSQPMSSAGEIADLIVDCAADGTLERAYPQSSAYLATLGYLVPQIPRLLRPLLERQGRAAKQSYIDRMRTRG